jgi:hypothetical protein
MTLPNSAPSALSRTSERNAPESRPTTPAIGGRSLANVPWPRRRLARRRGGSAGSSCRMPFFPRVLVQLIGLDGRIAQRVAVQFHPGVLLEAVPQLQEVLAVAAQLAGHLRRGRRLGDAAEDHQELGGAAVRRLEHRPGPGVEDAAAGGALVVEDRGAVTAVDAQAVPLAAVGAGQALGMQQVDELGVAGVLVQVIDQREVHRGASVRRGRSPLTTPSPGAGVKRLSTDSAS